MDHLRSGTQHRGWPGIHACLRGIQGEFRKQNLLSDTYPRGYDLILCRNVVIYFTEEAKAGITHRFYESLKPSGVLFIGATEALLQASDFGFQRISTCFYERIPLAGRKAA